MIGIAFVNKIKVRGDQEALHELVMNNPVRSKEVIELPQEYQWLRISLQLAKQGRKQYDSPNKKVIHWTGSSWQRTY